MAVGLPFVSMAPVASVFYGNENSRLDHFFCFMNMQILTIAINLINRNLERA